MIMNTSSRIASAAVIIDGVTPISMLMFASRIACHDDERDQQAGRR